MIIPVPAHPAACNSGASGAFDMLVAVQLSVSGFYLPPVPMGTKFSSNPPQTIISLPVHTAVCALRGTGELMVLVVVQLSVLGLYLPPVFDAEKLAKPPHTIISLPVQTAVPARASGGPAVA